MSSGTFAANLNQQQEEWDEERASQRKCKRREMRFSERI